MTTIGNEMTFNRFQGEVTEWIPVSERLPVTSGPVKGIDSDSLTPEKELIFEDDKFYYEAYGVRLDYTPHITHWKPL